MSSHILRDLPKQHVKHTLRPYFGYPKNGVKEGKFNFLPMTEVSYIGANDTNGHKREHGKFKEVDGASVVWGIFKRQVYRAPHPLMDGTEVLLKKDQKFIVAWPGNIIDGNFRPLSLWKGVMKNNNYTHYHLLAEVVSTYSVPLLQNGPNRVPKQAIQKGSYISHECVFVRRELIDSNLPAPKI